MQCEINHIQNKENISTKFILENIKEKNQQYP